LGIAAICVRAQNIEVQALSDEPSIWNWSRDTDASFKTRPSL